MVYRPPHPRQKIARTPMATFNTENNFVSEQNKKPTLQAEAYLSHS